MKIEDYELIRTGILGTDLSVTFQAEAIAILDAVETQVTAGDLPTPGAVLRIRRDINSLGLAGHKVAQEITQDEADALNQRAHAIKYSLEAA